MRFSPRCRPFPTSGRGGRFREAGERGLRKRAGGRQRREGGWRARGRQSTEGVGGGFSRRRPRARGANGRARGGGRRGRRRGEAAAAARGPLAAVAARARASCTRGGPPATDPRPAAQAGPGETHGGRGVGRGALRGRRRLAVRTERSLEPRGSRRSRWAGPWWVGFGSGVQRSRRRRRHSRRAGGWAERCPGTGRLSPVRGTASQAVPGPDLC